MCSLSEFEKFCTPPRGASLERKLVPVPESKTLGALCLAIISSINKRAITLASILGTGNASHQRVT